jgi:hypothetical protein
VTRSSSPLSLSSGLSQPHPSHGTAEGDDETIGEESLAHFKAALRAVEEGRAELLRLLHEGDVHDSVVHRIEAELDLEEIRLRKLVEAIAPESPAIEHSEVPPVGAVSPPRDNRSDESESDPRAANP